jgi:hypothetical protein
MSWGRIHSARQNAAVNWLIAGAMLFVLLQVCTMAACSGMSLAPVSMPGHGGIDLLSSWCAMAEDPGALPAVVTGTLVLIIALVALLALSADRLLVAVPVRIRVRRSNAPPPPPEDPRGERLRI